MPLTERQLAEYDERSLLAVPSVFTADEVAALNRTMERDWEIPGPHLITEDDGRTVRAVYACHLRWPISPIWCGRAGCSNRPPNLSHPTCTSTSSRSTPRVR